MKNLKEAVKNLSAGTVIRTACLILALVNQVLVAIGKSPLPIANADVELLISTAATIITALVAGWKNNSFTAAAQAGDEKMKELKKSKKGE